LFFVLFFVMKIWKSRFIVEISTTKKVVFFFPVC
jgi:hypothetical protein